ncbi:MAG: L-threonylcarbamoyladenylate synthase [Mycobacteriales bacterium]
MSLAFDCADPDQRAHGLDEAVAAINRGAIVVMPTDTVYGVGADAFSPAAVAALLAAKGRGREMPPPVLVGSWNGIDGLTTYVDDRTRSLVEAFWPGGLTIIVRHAPSLAWDLGDNRGTVAVRMPAHPVALELLRRTGPLAVTSANLTGQPAPATIADAQAQLGETVDVYLDGGPCPDTVASSMVDLTGDVPVLRRAGAVSVDTLREVVPDLQVPTP